MYNIVEKRRRRSARERNQNHGYRTVIASRKWKGGRRIAFKIARLLAWAIFFSIICIVFGVFVFVPV